ncbi:DUF2849 domain-containing protein [Jannaschia pohangensis]|uniref:Sulfite reductase (NADPH) hemoprotein beta-component n=1 Tax=Jannaschia pohangensis TaxID=390807 RepID=A0A1I3IDD0_9RHOB|nr:DUF2849 domain-containing protein [Jannaschia pohangensis]SFI45942.1 Protein of unknown function [Jannaschia pohangensis]
MSRKPFTPKVVTANLLREGDVVYLAADDTWVTDLALAEILTDEAHAEVRLIEGSQQPQVAVGVYLADVQPGPDGPKPTHFREDFRASGPTNYAHGKAHGQRPGPEV